MIPHNHEVIGRVCTNYTALSERGGGGGELKKSSTKIYHGCDVWAEWRHLSHVSVQTLACHYLVHMHVLMKCSHSDYHYSKLLTLFLCDAKWLNQSRAITGYFVSIVVLLECQSLFQL